MPMERRKFLKLSAGTALALGLTPWGLDKLNPFYETPGEPPGPGLESWSVSVCQQCPGGCGIRVRLVDGQPKRIEGNPFHPINRGALCPLGLAGLQVLYDPDRLKGPMKRTGKRGVGSWEAISWEEGLTLLASRLKELRQADQAHTLMVIGGQYRGLMKSLWSRFLEAFGSPNYITSSTREGAEKAIYLTQGLKDSVVYDLENCNYLLSFGSNLLETWWAPVRQMAAYGQLRQGRLGFRAKMVQIDPRYSVTAAKADEWIPINPGTDAALALGLAHILIREELYDEEFVTAHTFGFEDWKNGAGTHQGFKDMVLKDYPPGEVSKITGVPVETIIRLAREFSRSRPALAIAGRGPGLYTNGLYNRAAIHSLNALVGSVGVKGGVVHQLPPPFTMLPPVAKDQAATKGWKMPPIGQPGQGLTPLAEASLAALPEAINKGEPYKVKALLVYYSNPLFSSLDLAGLHQALEQVPFIVSFSPFMDETSERADLLLPDHTYLERWQDDPAPPSFGYPFFGIRQPVVAPLYNTRNSADVVIELARRLGGSLADSFPWKDFQELLSHAVKGALEQGRGSSLGVDFEASWYQFLRERGWQAPSHGTPEEFWKQLVERGGWWDPSYEYGQWQQELKTPSGKFEFYFQALRNWMEKKAGKEPTSSATNGHAILKSLGVTARGDRAFMPHYEPARFFGQEKEYPFHLNSFKLVTHAGGRGANQPHLQETLGLLAQRRWESWVEINPEAAHKLGISEGDWIWVESPKGRIKTRAKLHPGVKPQVVNIPFELGHKAYGRWASGRGVNPNWLLETDYDRLAGTASWYCTRVRLYKVTGG